MFTNSPDLCFDVKRKSDRCVCGCSATTTNQDGIDAGYCDECAKIRRTFVEEVVGNICLPNAKVIDIIECIRKTFFQERVYYMVDKYVVTHHLTDLQKLYEDNSFMAKVYREKYSMMQNFMLSLPQYLQSKKDIRNVYDYYLAEINKMLESDYEKLEEFTARAGGYTYSKNC